MTTVDARACGPIILDPLALTQLTHAHPLQPTEVPDLRAYLATIHDLRSPRGRRHPRVVTCTPGGGGP